MYILDQSGHICLFSVCLPLSSPLLCCILVLLLVVVFLMSTTINTTSISSNSSSTNTSSNSSSSNASGGSGLPPVSSSRPSVWLLSLVVGSEVDALDEIGYRQWRHAIILELGHLPGQTIHDSAPIGQYKIRWKGWSVIQMHPITDRILGRLDVPLF